MIYEHADLRFEAGLRAPVHGIARSRGGAYRSDKKDMIVKLAGWYFFGHRQTEQGLFHKLWAYDDLAHFDKASFHGRMTGVNSEMGTGLDVSRVQGLNSQRSRTIRLMKGSRLFRQGHNSR